MKGFIKISLLFVLVLNGCGLMVEKSVVSKTDFEFEVINTVLRDLIPAHSPCMPVPQVYESDEAYEAILQAYYDRIDSVGKKIEILSKLNMPNPRFFQGVAEVDSSAKMQLLLRSPREDRFIDESLIKEIEDVQIVFVKERRSTLGGLTDCYTLGQLSFSRVGFNPDSTRAAVRYFIDNGSCQGSGDILQLIREDLKWEIVAEATH